jgi:hypothetical protein
VFTHAISAWAVARLVVVGKRPQVNLPRGIKLWPHQAKAVRMSAPYLEAYVGRSRQKKAAALVNIPTGGGKTAVIGAIGHWHPKVNVLLVVAPRSAIRDQLSRELGGKRGFFLRSSFGPKELPKQVLAIRSVADLPKVIARAPFSFLPSSSSTIWPGTGGTTPVTKGCASGATSSLWTRDITSLQPHGASRYPGSGFRRYLLRQLLTGMT